MDKCRKCRNKKTIKYGKTKEGKQRYFCKDCKFHFVLIPCESYSEEKKQEIIKAYLKNPNMSYIQRTYGINRKTLSKWLKDF